MKTQLVLGAVLVHLARLGLAQGFINLDFEQANISGTVFSRIPATNAFPGWIVNTPLVYYNDVSLSGGSISICDFSSFLGINPAQGNYFTFVAGVNTPGPGNDITISIGQVGQVPPTAQSIQFSGSIGKMQISFGGQPLPFTTIATTPNYRVYGADISAFAGQTGQLMFSLPPFMGNAFLDNIQFSPEPIPEPGSLGLLGLGAFFLGWRLLRRLRS